MIELFAQRRGFERQPWTRSVDLPLELDVVLAGELCRLRPTLESAFLEDRGDVGVGQEVSEALLVPVENHPHPGAVVRITKDGRTLAPVLLSLLSALGGERPPEAVEILDFRGSQDHLGPPSVVDFPPSDSTRRVFQRGSVERDVAHLRIPLHRSV